MENNKSSYYYRLDIYRFIFTVFVVVLHFEQLYRTLPQLYHLSRSLYRSVDFFFLLGGFLLFRSFKNQHYANALDFTLAKARRLIPINFTVIICTCLFMSLHPIKGMADVFSVIKNFVHYVICTVPNLLFLQEFIPVFEIFCGGDYFIPLWYISAMLLSSFIWFWFLKAEQHKYGENCKAFSWGLVIAVFLYSYLINIYGSINVSQGAVPGLNLAPGFLRGLADIGLGIFCANYSVKINNKKIQGLLKLILPLLLFVLAFYAAETVIDFVFIAICAFVLVFEFSIEEEPGLLIQKLCKFAGKISIPIYFSHAFVIIIVYTPVFQKWPSIAANVPLNLAVRAVLVAAVSLVFYVISKLLEKPFEKFYSLFKTVAEAESNAF